MVVNRRPLRPDRSYYREKRRMRLSNPGGFGGRLFGRAGRRWILAIALLVVVWLVIWLIRR